MRWLRAAACGLVLLATSNAHAEAPAAGPRAARWHLTPELTSTLPVDIGVRAEGETPFRLRLVGEVGVLPSSYVSLMNTVLQGFGAYSADTGTLIKSAIGSSLVVRLRVGYRFFPKYGFYADAGYMLVVLGGSATGPEIIQGVTGAQVPEGMAGRSYDATSTLHMLDVEVGYRFYVDGRWSVRASLGGIFTFAAHTRITPPDDARETRAMQAFTEAGADYLDDVYRSYVFSPTVGLGVGYTFF